MKRREFLKGAAAAAGAASVGLFLRQSSGSQKDRKANAQAAQNLARRLPRWRGFNLLEKFTAGRQQPFVESDFEWMSQWGFNFVRLPMDYRCWTDPTNPYRYEEQVLKEIDQAVELGRRYGVHVSLNLHRAPGYTVADPSEKLNLWAEEESQQQFDAQWAQFARRYRGIPSSQLSFNLVNEPGKIEVDAFVKVIRRVVAAIRREDPDRLIINDGLSWSREPVFELADLGIAQSTRGYDPMRVSHYKASWVGGQRWEEPTWPLKEGQKVYDRNWLYLDRIVPWKKLQSKGVGVHVGEWGAFNKTPHAVVLKWARDFLELWKEAGWGWAMWNFRGSFGILDSQRADVTYEQFHGRALDRKLLELLRQY